MSAAFVWPLSLWHFLVKGCSLCRPPISISPLHSWAQNGDTTKYSISQIMSIGPKTTQKLFVAWLSDFNFSDSGKMWWPILAAVILPFDKTWCHPSNRDKTDLLRLWNFGVRTCSICKVILKFSSFKNDEDFCPAWDTVKLNLQVGFICPFVVIEPTDLSTTIVIA